MNGEQTGRRDFLRRGAAAGLAVSAMSARRVPGANERVRMAFIGCGGRGRQLMRIFRRFEDVDIPAVSDVIKPRMEQALEWLLEAGPAVKPGGFPIHEELLERPDIDAAVIATTQHWHGIPHIQALKAGKHVFVEKPLSHTVAEGRAMVRASQYRKDRVSMIGTQQRAGGHYQKAVETIRAGRLGTVALVECWNYHNTGNRVGRPPDAEAPDWIDWDRWLGPAPLAPYNPARISGEWWFDYGGGMMTNWAIHHIDIVLWAMGEQSPRSVSCSGGKYIVNDLGDTPDTIEAAWQFGDWTMRYGYRGFNNFHTVFPRPNHHGIAFHGSDGVMVLDRFGYQIWNPENEVIETMRGDPEREQNVVWQRAFVDAVKGLAPPPSGIEEGHAATVCCHLANIAYRMGGTVNWDGVSETIPGDPAANAMLDYDRREGYRLPPV